VEIEDDNPRKVVAEQENVDIRMKVVNIRK
jgi:hypothetical protein